MPELTPDRIKIEMRHKAIGEALEVVSREIGDHFKASFDAMALKIMRVGTDEERRDIAADMRAIERLKSGMHEAIQRGRLAAKTLKESIENV